MEELYIINTTVNPYFLDVSLQAENPEHALRGEVEFNQKVRSLYPEFNKPFLALFSDGALQVPTPGPLHGGLMGNVRGLDVPLDEFIAKYRVGKDTIWLGQTIPITAVVEFSGKELYPEVMRKLERKYDITRVFIRVFV